MMCYTTISMYLGIDIGGTKTLVASLTNEGVIQEAIKFPTPQSYPVFLQELAKTVADLSSKDFLGVGVAVPGKLDREKGIGIVFGNLPWKDVPIQHDIKRIIKRPVLIENDANLAGLSEAMLLKQYSCVLYVTVSTGIGTGIITNQQINPEFADSEGGHILLEYKGRLQMWEHFASGQAIVKHFGKRASDITDQKTWKVIAHNIAIGLYDLIAFIQPDAVVLGGGVMEHLDKFDDLLKKELQHFATPLTPIPPIYRAQRPNEAVVYGCYDLVKQTHGSIHTTT
jgi:predicted NBD/HSP70 family sugar kinase